MKNYIIGNSVTSYIIAATLDYLTLEFSIVLNDRPLTIPPLLLLKYESEQELVELFEIFKLELSLENRQKYTKRINVGYLYEGKLHSKLTDKAKLVYLTKQKRLNSNSNMSDSLNSFNAILLHKIVPILQNRYASKVVEKTEDKNSILFNSLYNENHSKNVYLEYITKEKLIDLLEFDYVYDCEETSNIKRYTTQFVEYFSKPTHINSFEIKNYYDEATIYTAYNVVRNQTTIDIGRLATQSQLKQEDVIRFILNRRL